MIEQIPRDSGRQPHSGETRKRFARLRVLRHNPRLRRRLLLAAGALALVVVAALATLVRLFTVLSFDLWFTRGVQSNLWGPATTAMYVVSLFGYAPWSVVTVGVGALLAGALFGWRDGAYLVAITVAQGLINAAIKTAIGRPRPLNDVVDVFAPSPGFSFPSGHVMFYTVFFGFLAFLLLARLPGGWLRWLLAAPALALVALVGPSRIILGAHWLSDVIAAYLIGLSLLAVSIEVYLERLAPPRPAEQGGLVGRYDEQEERAFGE